MPRLFLWTESPRGEGNDGVAWCDRPVVAETRRGVLRAGGGVEKNGVVEIASGKRIDWNAIRLEYIGGKASYRSLAEKYGVSKDMIARKAKSEKWKRDRATASDKAATLIIQKTARAVADNATLAADIKRRLLLRIQRIETQFPQDATEIREDHGQTIYRLRDLTAALKDLTGDMPKGEGPDVEDLSPLVELLGGKQ